MPECYVQVLASDPFKVKFHYWFEEQIWYMTSSKHQQDMMQQQSFMLTRVRNYNI